MKVYWIKVMKYIEGHIYKKPSEENKMLSRKLGLGALPSYGQLEIVLELAAAGGSGASKNPAPSTSNTTQSSTPHHL